MFILGIDPGTKHLGFGVIEKLSGQLRFVGGGTIKISESLNAHQKLLYIDKKISALMSEFEPEIVGLEKVFFSKNKKTAMEISQARGVVIVAANRAGKVVAEFSPSEIKLAVAGDGNASKRAVSKMVGYSLNIGTSHLGPDTTDALAIAIAASANRF